LEKYDTGFNKDSKILGWSMKKHYVHFGILENMIYTKPAPIAEWQDKRKKLQQMICFT
jgi:hypothetical protein